MLLIINCSKILFEVFACDTENHPATAAYGNVTYRDSANYMLIHILIVIL